MSHTTEVEQLQAFLDSLLDWKVEGESLIFWALSQQYWQLNGARHHAHIISQLDKLQTLSKENEVKGWISVAVIEELRLKLPKNRNN